MTKDLYFNNLLIPCEETKKDQTCKLASSLYKTCAQLSLTGKKKLTVP